ncbi:MAG: hypothetical protein ACXWFU_13895 [Actinomycetota bacterium]
MGPADGRDRELDARLDRANEQIDQLREANDRSGNVVRFRMARSLQSLIELVVDLSERSKPMPPAGTYERRTFERDLGSLEDEIAVTFAEFASQSWWRRMFRRGRGAPDPIPRGRSGPARPTKEVGREERRSEYARTDEGAIVPAVMVTGW